MGIMGLGRNEAKNPNDEVKVNPRTSKDFMPIHLSLIRSRTTSPGQ
jgi:hypothetical protein